MRGRRKKNTNLYRSAPLQGQGELRKVEPTGVAEEWKYEPFYFHGRALFFPFFLLFCQPIPVCAAAAAVKGLVWAVM